MRLWMLGVLAGALAAPIAASAQEQAPPQRVPVFKTSQQVAGLGPPGGYFPDAAARQGVGGYATIDCMIEPSGALRDCKLVKVAPAGWGFDESALRMAKDHYISAAPRTDGQTPTGPEPGRLTIIYPKPRI